MANNNFINYIKTKLKEISKKNQFRHLETFQRKPNNILCNKNKKLISFSCNDYLSLSNDDKVKEAASKAALKYGTGAGASRLVTGNHPLYNKLERKLAKIKNSEACLIFGSGYLAVVGIISALVKKSDLIVLDEYSHSCAFLGAKASGAKTIKFKHNNMKDLERILAKTRSKYNNCLVITEGVFSMDGDISPKKNILKIKKKYNAFLLLDDAHGLNFFEQNQIISKSSKQKCYPDIYIGTLSKAIGSYGGYVCAKKEIIDFILNRCRTLIYTTGLPPSVIAASLKSLEIIENRKSLLTLPLKKAKYFCKKMHLIYCGTPIIPIILESEVKTIQVSEFLLNKGFIVSAIRPPTVPANSSRLRLAFNVSHTTQQIDNLVIYLKEALEKVDQQ